MCRGLYVVWGSGFYQFIYFLFFPQTSTEDKHDDLCADFSEVNKAILNVKERIQGLAEQSASQAHPTEKSKGTSKGQKTKSEMSTQASQKLAELRSELTRLEMEKLQLVDKMEQVE